MGKVKCHTCGHFSIIRADHGFIKGCYIFNLVDDDDDLYNVDKISQITEGNESATFHKIDTKFILNKITIVNSGQNNLMSKKNH